MQTTTEVRKATMDDLEQIRRNFAAARELMRRNGNPNQWGSVFPLDEWVVEDIQLGRSMLLVDHEGEDGDERILAQFAVCEGAEPTYARIEDGRWLDDDPYVTVHRLASSGLRSHCGRACLEWTVEQYGNVRVDTHPDNAAMNHVFATAGFTRCGIINVDRVAGDDARIAYQRHDR